MNFTENFGREFFHGFFFIVFWAGHGFFLGGFYTFWAQEKIHEKILGKIHVRNPRSNPWVQKKIHAHPKTP